MLATTLHHKFNRATMAHLDAIPALAPLAGFQVAD